MNVKNFVVPKSTHTLILRAIKKSNYSNYLAYIPCYFKRKWQKKLIKLFLGLEMIQLWCMFMFYVEINQYAEGWYHYFLILLWSSRSFLQVLFSIALVLCSHDCFQLITQPLLVSMRATHHFTCQTMVTLIKFCKWYLRI